MSTDCLLCGAKDPPGHVQVYGPGRRRKVGRVCSKHTLKSLILDTKERFMVEIIVTDEGVRALERVEAKHKRQLGAAGMRLP